MIKILIVEDEEPIANLIRMNLVKAGYQCEIASDGELAADAISERSFDLILLDIMLPKLNGYEVLEYAKSVDTPVIFLTAMGETGQKVKGLRLGAEDYIAKPFEIAELLARVETVLRRCKKTDRQLRFLNIDIDTDSRTVLQDGHPVDLTTTLWKKCSLPYSRSPHLAMRSTAAFRPRKRSQTMQVRGSSRCAARCIRQMTASVHS